MLECFLAEGIIPMINFIFQLCTANQDILAQASTIASVGLSLIAIVISIRTTRKQNKISLFEIRYQVYQKISKWMNLSNVIIQYANSNQDAREIFKALWDCDTSKNEKEMLRIASLAYREIVDESEKLSFLFSLKEEKIKILWDILKTTSMILMGNSFSDLKAKLSTQADSVEIKELLNAMKKELHITP